MSENPRPTVQAHAAELARLFTGCVNEVLGNVGVADRLDPEGLPADLVAFVGRVRNDVLEEAAAQLEGIVADFPVRSRQAPVVRGMAGVIRSLKS